MQKLKFDANTCSPVRKLLSIHQLLYKNKSAPKVEAQKESKVERIIASENKHFGILHRNFTIPPFRFTFIHRSFPNHYSQKIIFFCSNV